MNHHQTPPSDLTIPTDYGPYPFIVDIGQASLHNPNYRTVLWSGNHLQLALMNIPIGEDIGLEVHPYVDQYLRIEHGTGVAHIGDSKQNLYIQQPVYVNDAIFIPAGAWHNITNTGSGPLKISTLYAPPNHPWGTIQQTKASAGKAEES